jgi:hypothetical protein
VVRCGYLEKPGCLGIEELLEKYAEVNPDDFPSFRLPVFLADKMQTTWQVPHQCRSLLLFNDV